MGENCHLEAIQKTPVMANLLGEGRGEEGQLNPVNE